MRYARLSIAFLCLSTLSAWAADGVRQALRGAIPISSSDSIASLTRYSATRLGVTLVDEESGKKSRQWTDLSPETMQTVLEAASVEGLAVTVADPGEEPAASSPSRVVRTASVASASPRSSSIQRSHRSYARAPDESEDRRSRDPDAAHNRLVHVSYQTLLSTYIYGIAIPVAFGVDNPRLLIASPLVVAPLAFGTHLWFSRNLDFTESHLKGTIYMPTLATYAATALPLAFTRDFKSGYQLASLMGAVAYPLSVWYGYQLGETYRSHPEQIDAKWKFALGYAFVGFVTPTLYFEHPSDHSNDILRVSLAQSVGMAAVGHFVADYYPAYSDMSSGVMWGMFSHALLGAMGGMELAALYDASSLRPWLGATVIGATAGFTEGVFFFQDSHDSFDRARYGLLGMAGGAMVGTGLELIFYDSKASAYEQKVAWSSALIGGAWLGYAAVYLLTSNMTESGRARTETPADPSAWAFNPLPTLEPAISRGELEMRLKIPGFSRHF